MTLLKEGETNRIISSRRAEDLLKELGGTIESSAFVHGEYDWIVTDTASGIRQTKKYFDTLIALHPGEIQNVTLSQPLIFIKKTKYPESRKNAFERFLLTRVNCFCF